MNKILTVLIAVLLHSFSVNAQRTCSTMENLERLKRNDPSLEKRMEKLKRIANQWIADNPNQASRAVITIPVVVHVVYKTAAENISDAQIQSQLTVMNADFRRLNTDASSTPAAFQSVATDAQIEFCLAQRDPNGLTTTGITRTSTSVASFGDDDKVKYTAQGGHDAWNTTQYLNLWSCNLGSGLLGYAQFPGGPSATDGVVIGYTNFGTTGAVQAPYNKGRTATHEIGHWLGLYHIWGDANCGDDGIADTPTQQADNGGCPSFPHVTCSNGPNGDMFMNYMDYTDDNCMNMFTAGQSTAMTAAINSSRAGLKTSMGCVPVNLASDDAGISAVDQPTGNICSTTVTPVVTIKNFGSANLTSATISYAIDGGTAVTYSWTGNLASQATASVTLSSSTVAAGSHTISASTSLPNGSTDATTSNDASSGSFAVVTTGQSLPLSESFEGTFAPSGWTLNNGDAAVTWAKTNTAKVTGSNSIFMDNFNYNASNEYDELVLPALNMTTGTSPMLTFQVAYQLYTNPTANPSYSDTLQVLISTDCGATYTSLYKKYGSNLTTVTPAFSTNAFVPANANQWRKETVDLSAYAASQNVIIKFRHIASYENNMYLDDVNVSSFGCGLSIASGTVVDEVDGDASGSISVTTSGASGAVTYAWSPSGSTSSITGLSAGNYSVIVEDTLGCKDSATYTVSNYICALEIASGTVVNSTNSASNGSIAITTTGASGAVTYAWSPSGGTSATATALASGSYSVTVTDSKGCTDVAYYEVGNTTTGINSLSDAKALKIYPNPSAGIITVETTFNLESMMVSVYNVLGDVVYETRPSGNSSKIRLDLSTQSEGVYLIKFINNGEISTRRIVISK